MAEGFAIKLNKCPSGRYCESGYRCIRGPKGGMCAGPKLNHGNPSMQRCSNGGFCKKDAKSGGKFCLYPQKE